MPISTLQQVAYDSAQQFAMEGVDTVCKVPLSDVAAFYPSFDQGLQGGLKHTLYGLSHVDKQIVPSPFANISHFGSNLEMHLRDNQSVSVFFFSFLVFFCFLALIRYFRVFSPNMTKTSDRYFKSVFVDKEESSLKSVFVFHLFITLILGVSSSLWVVLGGYGFLERDWNALWRIFGSVAAYFAVQSFILFISALLMDIFPQVKSYFREKIIIFYNMLLLCLPLVLLDYFYSFVPQWLVVLVIGIAFVYILVRGFFIFSKKIKLYGFFLYFCTLEILPFLLLVKYYINN